MQWHWFSAQHACVVHHSEVNTLLIQANHVIKCNELSPSGEFSKLTNWTEACDMSYTTNSWSNGRKTGQDGLVVMRWDFWLSVNGFLTTCVLHRRSTPNRTSQMEWADITSRDKSWISIDRLSLASYVATGQSQKVWWNRLAEQMTDHRDLFSSRNTRSSWLHNKFTSFVRYLRPPYGEVYHTH